MGAIKPTVTALVVNFNGLGVIEKCVRSVLNSDRQIKVVVVDNGSVDGSPEILKKDFAGESRLKIIRLKSNRGPAFARNYAMSKIKTKYVAFLDNDTQVDKKWLRQPIGVMEKDKQIASCQCKLVLSSDHKKLDYVGDYISQLGFLVQRCKTGEKDHGQYEQIAEILSAKSAGMLVRNAHFRSIGGFDSDYFIYVEETDLGWRFWLSGFKNVYCPQSIVFHEYGTTAKRQPNEQNFRAKFHGSKNYILTLFKCLESKNLIYILLPHILLWLGMAMWFCLKGQFKNATYIFRGVLWNMLNSGDNFKKRKVVQKSRTISDEKLFKIIMRKRDFAYFYQKLVGAPNLRGVRGYSQKQ